MKQIQLTRGKFALVDDSDFEAMSALKWYATEIYNTFYAVRVVTEENGKRKMVYMHRLIIGAACDGLQVDHVDMNGLNNQRNNLRACTRSENQRNRAIDRNNTSGFKGVSWDKKRGKWRAYIRLNGKEMFLGRFAEAAAAYAARCDAAVKLHGEFARMK